MKMDDYKKLFVDKTTQSFFTASKNDNELLICYRDPLMSSNFFSIYHDGLRYAEIGGTPNFIKQHPHLDANVKSALQKSLLTAYSQYPNEIKSAVKLGMPKMKERRRQQVIATKNKTAPYVVCDFEFAVQSNILKGYKPEFDLIAVNRTNDKIVIAIIEYKCTPSALKGKSGIVQHYEDFIRSSEMENIKIIKESILLRYNTLCELGILSYEPISHCVNDIEVMFSFLFTDLDSKQYIRYLEKINDGRLPVKIAHFNKPEDVMLSEACFIELNDFLKQYSLSM